jgi:hypothetical protein
LETTCDEKLSDIDIRWMQILSQAQLGGQSILSKAHAELKKIDEEKRNWQEEKKIIAQTYNFEDNEIKLDIGGQCFTTTLTSLKRFPDTIIGAMFSGRHNLKKNASGAYFLDRDGTHFRQILNFLRAPESYQISTSPLESASTKELMVEASYYGLGDRMFPSHRIGEACSAGAQQYQAPNKEALQKMYEKILVENKLRFSSN